MLYPSKPSIITSSSSVSGSMTVLGFYIFTPKLSTTELNVLTGLDFSSVISEIDSKPYVEIP